MSKHQTFVDACLSGSALLDDVDDWVDDWHDSGGKVGTTSVSLDAYLGFRPDEGALWAEKPESLRFIIAAHRYNRSVDDLLKNQDEFALVARSKAPDEAEAVLRWLRETGRLAKAE